MRFYRLGSVVLASALTVGCSTASKDIAAVYVSPMQYQAYDCEQLIAEMQRIHGRASQLAGRLDEAAGNDKALLATSLLFWPTLFALGGTKQQEAEYSRLRGEHDAAIQMAIQKKCQGISAAGTPPSPEPTKVAPDSGASRAPDSGSAK